MQNEEKSPTRKTNPAWIRWLPFPVAGLVILLDQFSKYLVEANLPVYTYWAPIPALENLFRVTHTTNTGAAFGLFPAGSLFFAVMAVVVTTFIIYFNFTLEGNQVLLRVALGLVLAGALGNFIDRVRLGHVTDFLDFGPWAIFNVADTAVVSGVIIMGWVMLQEERAASAKKKAAKANEAAQNAGE